MREVPGANLDFGQLKDTPRRRANAFELDRELQQLEQNRASTRQLPGVEQRLRELELRALVGLGDPAGSRLDLDPVREQLLVEAVPGVEAGDCELAGRRREHPGRLDLRGRLDGELRVSKGGAVVAPEPAHARQDGVRRDGDVGRVLRLGERALLVADGIGPGDRVDLGAEPTEPDEHPCPLGPGRQHVGEVLERGIHVLPSFAGRLVEVGGPHETPCPRLGVTLGRERGGALRERSCGLRRATCILAIRGTLELQSNCLVRHVRSATEVESTLVRIVERGGQRQMDAAPLLGRMHFQEGRGEEWMREPHGSGALVHDAGGTELEDVRVTGRSGHYGVEAAENGGCEPRRTRAVGHAREARAERDGERLGHAPFRASGSRELECVVGASSRELRDPAELRWGQSATRALEDDAGEMPLRKPADLDPLDRAAVTFSEARQLEVRTPRRTVATSPTGALSSRRYANVRARRLGASTHCRSSTATSSGGGGEEAKDAERREGDCHRVDRRGRLRSPERLLQSGALDAGKLSELRVVDGPEQIRQAREREIGFGLRRSHDEDAEVTAQRLLDDDRPDRRLADPGLTCEEQCARPQRGFGEKTVCLGELPLAADHGTIHVRRPIALRL